MWLIGLLVGWMSTFQAHGADSLVWSNYRSPVFKSLGIRSFARDRDRIFFGTSRGLYYKQKDENRFSSLFSPFDSLYINAIHTGEGGIVWVATFSGVYKVDLASLKVVAHYTKAGEKEFDGTPSYGGLSSDTITCISGNDEYIYVGTDRWGINLIDARTGQVLRERITSIDGLPTNSIRDIYITPSMLVVATESGPAWQSRWDREWESPPDNSQAKGVKAQQAVFFDNRIWLATRGDGLMVFSPDTPDQVQVYNSAKRLLPSDSVRCLAVDGRTLWVATLEGMVRLDADTLNFTVIPPFTKEILTRVFIDGNRVFVGSDGEGVFVADKGTPEIAFFPEIQFEGPTMKLLGALVSDAPLQTIRPGQVRYRDADIQSEFTTSGVTISPATNGMIWHAVIATLDFGKVTGGVGKMWNFEVDLDIVDAQGRSNRATERYLYNSKKPRIDIVRYGNDSVAFSGQRQIKLEGKVVTKKSKSFTLDIAGEKRLVNLDRNGNFSEPVSLKPGTNQVRLVCRDACENVTERGLTLILDETPPALVEPPADFGTAESSISLVFPYVEENLENATLRDLEDGLPLPVQVDRDGRRVLATVKTPERPRKFLLELVDKSLLRTNHTFTVQRDGDRPLITLTAGTNEIFTDFKSPRLTGQVEGVGDITVTIKVGSQVFPVEYTPASKRFKTPFLNLPAATNRLLLKAVNHKGSSSEKWITVVSKLMAGEGEAGGAKTEVVESEVDKLRRENAILRTQKQVVVAVNPGLPGDFFGPVPALLLDRVGAQEPMENIARRYYGDATKVQVLLAVNAGLSPESLRSRGQMVIPNGAMVNLLLQSGNPALLELVKTLSDAHFSGVTASPYRLKSALDAMGGGFSTTLEGGGVVLRSGGGGQALTVAGRSYSQIALATSGGLVRFYLQ